MAPRLPLEDQKAQLAESDEPISKEASPVGNLQKHVLGASDQRPLSPARGLAEPEREPTGNMHASEIESNVQPKGAGVHSEATAEEAEEEEAHHLDAERLPQQQLGMPVCRCCLIPLYKIGLRNAT